MSKYTVTDGMKSIDFPAYPNEAWTWMTNPPPDMDAKLYSKVAAVFRAINLSADAVANLPFAIMRGEEDIDTSDNWTNAVGFLPDPFELLRLWRTSLFITNTAYGRYGKNAVGKVKRLYYCTPATITPNFDNNGDVKDFTRTVNGGPITLQPVKDIIYIWRGGYETEIKASENTEFRALMNSAGVIYWADFFIENYFQRGGVKPTFIGVKGVVGKEVKEEMERGVNAWIKNISRFTAKLFNAEAVDVKTIGDGVAELKDNATYRQAIENIAMASGMPLSLLLANSASYATAQTEYTTWFRDSVVPWAGFIAGKLNEQIFTPLGLHFEFRPEMTDPNQEDEVSKASAFQAYMNAFKESGYEKPASLAAQIVGIELPAGMEYDELDPVKPEPEQQEEPKEPEPAEEPEPAAKWTPNIEQLREMELWQKFAYRKQARGQPLDFEFEVKTLPDDIAADVRAALLEAKTADDIRAAFEITTVKSDILILAEAINKLASARESE